jgi:hypothetical protein
VKAEGVLVLVMAAHGKMRIWLHLFLTSTISRMNELLHASVIALHEKLQPESNERKAGWTTELNWTLRNRGRD